MIKKVKKYFIPHRENDFKPHVFREASVVAILAIVLGIFAYATLLPILERTGLTAAIYSSVLVEGTNHDRAATSSLPPLTVNPLLQSAAQAKADDEASKGYFAHTAPDGTTPWYWIKQSGYNYVYAGENLAVDFTDSADVESAWMNSPLHRENILNSHFTEVGIGIANGVLDGKPTTFVVQMFGSPRLAVESAPSTSAETPTSTLAIATPSNAISTTSIPANSTRTHLQISASSKNLSTTTSSSTLLATSKVEGESVGPSTPSSSIALSIENTPVYVPWYEKLVVSPSQTLKVLYSILGFLILISLALFIFIEWRTQHPKNIFYAVLLLVIIISLFALHWSIFFSNTAVV